jgi:hypothetical protein
VSLMLDILKDADYACPAPLYRILPMKSTKLVLLQVLVLLALCLPAAAQQKQAEPIWQNQPQRQFTTVYPNYPNYEAVSTASGVYQTCDGSYVNAQSPFPAVSRTTSAYQPQTQATSRPQYGYQPTLRGADTVNAKQKSKTGSKFGRIARSIAETAATGVLSAMSPMPCPYMSGCTPYTNYGNSVMMLGK